MSNRRKRLTFGDMASWLRRDFRKEGYDVSDILEEERYLPVDLFCTKGKGQAAEYCLVLIASIDNISQEFQKRLAFYRYYLSLHYSPAQYRIVLAIPASAKVTTTPFYAEQKEEKRQDFYKENGFGLWRITDKGEIDKETYGAMTLRDKIAEDFGRMIAKKDKRLLRRTRQILLFVDRYVHDSVLGIAVFNPIKFGERYIDAKSLELALELKKVLYKDRLFELISEHLSKKDKDDYEFCTHVLNTLWVEYLNEERYPEEHWRLEQLLIQLYPRYRDHYVHQLQVFLLGVLIIDFLIENRAIGSTDEESFCKSWLLAASFHDYGYPVERFDDYASRFINLCLGIPERLTVLELKNDYTEFSFSSDVEHILCSLANCFRDEDFKGQTGTGNLNTIREFFYHRITIDKNHGLLGSLGLMKKFKDKLDFANVVLPAAIAIALHDPQLWQPLHGLEPDKTSHERVHRIKKLAPLCRLDFRIQPLAFLLVLFDNIHDWGRHFKDEALEEPLRQANIRLKNIVFNSAKKITIQLYFNETGESRKFMKYKDDVLTRIKRLLKSPNVTFVVEYWDREKDEKTSYRYKIGGKA